jgi:hypothetical protein
VVPFMSSGFLLLGENTWPLRNWFQDSSLVNRWLGYMHVPVSSPWDGSLQSRSFRISNAGFLWDRSLVEPGWIRILSGGESLSLPYLKMGLDSNLDLDCKTCKHIYIYIYNNQITYIYIYIYHIYTYHITAHISGAGDLAFAWSLGPSADLPVWCCVFQDSVCEHVFRLTSPTAPIVYMHALLLSSLYQSHLNIYIYIYIYAHTIGVPEPLLMSLTLLWVLVAFDLCTWQCAFNVCWYGN